MSDRIPDEAVVVRGGRNLPIDLERAWAMHPSGVPGVSVQYDVGVPVETLAATVPHGRVGVTSVGAIGAAGGDVIRTAGRTPRHATLNGLTPAQASRLLTPTIVNPTGRQ